MMMRSLLLTGMPSPFRSLEEEHGLSAELVLAFKLDAILFMCTQSSALVACLMLEKILLPHQIVSSSVGCS